jgi:hypothetical protein
MNHRLAVGVLATTVLAFAGAVADESLKSGLQEGGYCTPFHPLNLTGPDAGKKQCLV